jgi:hypothetical protein
MHRTQIQLTNAQLEALRTLAAEDHRSLADVIRESIDAHMAHSGAAHNRARLVERARKAVGRYSSGRSDVGVRHDDYLSEAFR